MSALRPSLYTTITITSSEGKTLDLRPASVSVDFFEDILCPSMSAKIFIATAGGSIKDSKGDTTGIYSGLKLRGGESVQIRIEPNSSHSEPIELIMYVRNISDVVRDTDKEFFTINLISREAFEDQAIFLKKMYPKDVRISDHVKKIIDDSFENATVKKIDPTLNQLGFHGNQKHPMETIIRLASKSVSQETGTSSAGYFFFQTREGFSFRSVDALIGEEPKANYFYSEVNYSSLTDEFKPTPDLPSLDFKILSYQINRNQDLIEKLAKGAYATDRRFFDPISFKVSSPKDAFTGDKYIGGVKNLGERFDIKSLKLVDATKAFTETPTKILTEVFDYGTVSKEVDQELTKDLRQYFSQRKMRYNTLFTQDITMQIPLNTALHAGDIIKCKFPKVQTGGKDEIDEDQLSGLYMVKEVRHHFDPKISATALRIVRDTYGLYGANT